MLLIKVLLTAIFFLTVYISVKMIYTHYVYEEIEKSIAKYVCDKHFGSKIKCLVETVNVGNEAILEMMDMEDTMIDYGEAVLDLTNWKKETYVSKETYEKIKPYMKRRRHEKNRSDEERTSGKS